MENLKENVKKLTKSEVNKIGTWDRGGRFCIDVEFKTETSENVRSPSRAWPYSEYKHAFTIKYYNSLSSEQLEKIEKLTNTNNNVN